MPSNAPQHNGNAQTPPSGESDQDVRQRRSRADMNEAWREMNERARTATEKRRKRDEAEEDLEDLERRNAQFAGANASALLGYLLAAAIPFVAWAIDVVLLSRTAEYLIGPATSLGWVFSDYGVYIVPAALITFEMALSRQLVAAKREAQRYGELARKEDKKNYTRIKCMAAALAFAIPALAVSSLLAVELAGTGLREMSLVKWGAILPTAGVAAVAHGFMIYSPEWIHDARGCLLYRLRRWYRRGRARRITSAYERECGQVADEFEAYREAHARCDREHPNEDIELGPFSVHVRTALNDHYGFTFMPVPDELDEDGGDTTDTPPAPEPDTPEPDAPGGSDDSDDSMPTPPEAGGAPSGDGAMPPEPPAAAPPPAEPSAPREDNPAGDADDEGDGLEDYYQNLYEAQRRDADGEISL
jgi:hypothetical protein